MTAALKRPRSGWTAADIVARFGPIPLARIRMQPPPGTATEADVLELQRREKRLCELVDGVLIEKTMVFEESLLAAHLITLLWSFVQRRTLGLVTAPNGTVKLAPGLIRIPDVAFFSWDRLPGRAKPRQPIPRIVPDLAVEILSEGNTREEMERKLEEYFEAGVRLVWYIDPRAFTVDVYSGLEARKTLRKGQALDGGAVLKGFRLPLKKLFAEPKPA
jgi:Uma2 family endonuclease